MSKTVEKENKVLAIVKNPIALFLVFSILVIGALGYFAVTLTASKSKEVATSSDVHDDGDKQSVAILAKDGFSPSVVNLKSDKPTTLKISTKNTIDCSNTLVISSLNIRKDLPLSGDTEVTIPAQTAGSKVTATCSMGHYFLELNFL